MHLRRVCQVTLTTGVLVLTGCNTIDPGHPDHPGKHVGRRSPSPRDVTGVSSPLRPRPTHDLAPRPRRQLDVLSTARAISYVISAIAPPTSVAAVTAPHSAAPAIAATPIPMDVGAVMQCIKDHESGDYANHSNGPDGASGAYQYIGSTWRAWSVRAGHPGWSEAWLAPPAVQDAVTVYTLTHGGAGNWSPRWGDDPCTVGFGG